MFGIGFPELILILLVALIVFGPAKLPELAKTLGKAVKEFRRATDDFQTAFLEEENRGDNKQSGTTAKTKAKTSDEEKKSSQGETKS